MNLTSLKHRDDLGSWLNSAGLLGQGVEVGSLCGEYARTIISKWNGRELFLVDPWERQPDDVYREPTNHSDWKSAYQSCRLLADEYRPRVTLVVGYSPHAASWFVDGSLDFAYIDANHSLSAARADLTAWWPKVKPGGLLCGHDFRREFSDTQHCDVKTAVEEFVLMDLKRFPPHIHQTTAPGDGSWWIQK